MRRRIVNILSIILLIAGTGVLSYPFWSRWYAGEMQAVVMREYTDATDRYTPEEREAVYQDAVAYNEMMASGLLADEHGLTLGDPFTFADDQLPPGYEQQLSIPEAHEIMATVELPKLRIKLPVYHGVSETILQRGIGHLPQSALPVGGTSTHAVLAGHRGLRGSLLFTDIDELVIGDEFYIHVLDHTLAYEVDQIRVVNPDDIAMLAPAVGEDLVTLSTCTPLGINSHRLLVRGHRIPYTPVAQSWPDANTWQWFIALSILTFLILVLLFWWWAQKRKKQEELMAGSMIVHSMPRAHPILAIF
jgi:sortase A